MNVINYYRDSDGHYLGAFDVPPAGGIEVAVAPSDARQIWSLEGWLPLPEPLIVLYPVDLWSRMTNEEADQVEVAMTTQPARIQNIFRSASSYRSDHELWPLLETMATSLFGAERAAKILASS